MNDDNGWTDRRDELLARVVRQGKTRKLRRWALGATSVGLIVVLVGLGMVAARTSPTHSVRVANPEGSTTTLPPMRPPGVLLIGDAIMLGAQAALEREIPGAQVDAKVSRQFWDALPVLEARRAAGSLPGTIVIHLGNNGAFTADQFSQVMETVGPESEVYFLTTNVPRPWQAAVNDALHSGAVRWPNAHVLDWKTYSDRMPWFATDGFHLAGDGPAQYARFVHEGISPRPTTFRDPFAGTAVPPTGLYVTRDPKAGADQGPSSYAVSLFDDSIAPIDAARRLGELPRTTIDNDALNATRHTLAVSDREIRIEATPIDTGRDLPDGCTQTEAVRVLAVALCGPRFEDQLLGDRIMINRGSGWTDLIAKPPVDPGISNGGHWNWASPSPDGRWLLAAWSAECEVVTSMFVSVADGSVHTVTGEAGAAWANAPESGMLGWRGDGRALTVFGGEPACGSGGGIPRGVYVVSPDDGNRQLLRPLGPDDGVLRWTAVDDRRTRPQAEGSPIRVDLDGDGRTDELRVTPAAIGANDPSEMTATLADGRVVSGTIPSGFGVRVLGAADIAGDGRHEVVLSTGGETWTVGVIVVLDGDRLVAIDRTPDGSFLGWAQHSNSDPYGTTDLACLTVDGRPSLVVANSSLAGNGARRWHRSVYALDGAQLVLRARDSGALGRGEAARKNVPLANDLSCGSAGK